MRLVKTRSHTFLAFCSLLQTSETWYLVPAVDFSLLNLAHCPLSLLLTSSTHTLCGRFHILTAQYKGASPFACFGPVIC